MTASSKYQAGVCNIGKDEIDYRKKIVGYGSAIVGAALYTLLVFFNFPLIIYAALLVPVFISVHGFNEAKNEFCTTYARTGKYNMNSEVGLTQDVLSQAKRNQDRKYANKLMMKSLKISLAISALLIGVSRLLN